MLFLKKTTNVCQRKTPAAYVEGLCHPPAIPFGRDQGQKCQMEVLCFVIFPFFKHNNTALAFQIWNTLLSLWSSLSLYLLCNSFSRNPLVEESAPRAPCPLRGRAAAAAPGVPLFSFWLPLLVFLQSPWFVNCLHLFCQPTCTKCKK